MTPSTAPANPAPWRRPRTVIAAAVAVTVLLATGIAVWRLESGSSGTAATATRTLTTPVGIAAKVISADELRALATRLGRPVYWAGRRAGTRIEFTRSSDGSIFVRYLTGSATAGDKRSGFVVVATYAQPNAFARVLSVARTKHFRVEHLPHGAVAVTEPAAPRNIHLVFSSLPYQVEVYAPRAVVARRIVRSGEVTPVGSGG
jgi:hypothetical protein